MPTFSIHHITRYTYDSPIKESINQMRLYPPNDASQQVRSFEVQITGAPAIETYSDYYGNTTGVFTVAPPHSELTIDIRLKVETIVPSRSPDVASEQLGVLPSFLSKDIKLLQLALPEQISEQWVIENVLKGVDINHQTIAQLAWHCSEFIYRHFLYQKGITTVETTIDEILEHRSGVCQDFAHVLLQMLRTLGIPARYVSGYICPNRSGLRGEGATHAWVEYFDPPVGWVGIDPTNNVWATDNHVKLAVGRNFADCSPVKGTFRGIAKQSLSVYVSVGYEDGQVFEEVNEVSLQPEPEAELLPWQKEWLKDQQQQQQQ